MISDNSSYNKAFPSSTANIEGFPNCIEKLETCSIFDQLTWYLEKKEKVE